MTQSTMRQRTSPAVLLFLTLVPAAIIVGVLWFIWVQKPKQQAAQTSHQAAMKTLGLANPAFNSLDPRFTDADGDLVADPPSDPAALVDPPKLVFSYVAQEDAAGYKDAFVDFTTHLSKVTGKPVEYLEVTTTNDQLKALRDGNLHVTGFNTGSVPVAVYLCGFVPMCRIATADGTAVLHTEVIVQADSPIQTPKDLRGRELTLTEPNSNAGYKAPIVLLRSHFQLEPERDYVPRFSQGYDNSIKAFTDRQIEAAAVASDILERAVSSGQISKSQYRTIFRSESFPTACFGYAHNLKPELAARVREAFDTFKWEGTTLAKEFEKSKQGRFVPASFRDDWSLIRRIDELIGNTYKLD